MRYLVLVLVQYNFYLLPRVMAYAELLLVRQLVRTSSDAVRQAYPLYDMQSWAPQVCGARVSLPVLCFSNLGIQQNHHQEPQAIHL